MTGGDGSGVGFRERGLDAALPRFSTWPCWRGERGPSSLLAAFLNTWPNFKDGVEIDERPVFGSATQPKRAGETKNHRSSRNSCRWDISHVSNNAIRHRHNLNLGRRSRPHHVANRKSGLFSPIASIPSCVLPSMRWSCLPWSRSLFWRLKWRWRVMLRMRETHSRPMLAA